MKKGNIHVDPELIIVNDMDFINFISQFQQLCGTNASMSPIRSAL